MASGTPYAQVRVPVEDLVSPPHLCLHHTTSGKIYPAAEDISGGVKIMQRQNIYPAAGAGGPKIRKISQCRQLLHSTKNTLFHIHCEISSAKNRTLWPIHCRSYTL